MSDPHINFKDLDAIRLRFQAVVADLYKQASAIENLLGMAAGMASTLESVLDEPTLLTGARREGVERVSRGQIAAVKRACAGTKYGPAGYREASKAPASDADASEVWTECVWRPE